MAGRLRAFLRNCATALRTRADTGAEVLFDIFASSAVCCSVSQITVLFMPEIVPFSAA